MGGITRGDVGQWRVFAFNRNTSAPVTGIAGTITAKLSKDWGALAPIADTNPTEAEDGYYYFALDGTETDANILEIFPETSTLDTQIIGVPGTMFTKDKDGYTISGQGRIDISDGVWGRDETAIAIGANSIGRHMFTIQLLNADKVIDKTTNPAHWSLVYYKKGTLTILLREDLYDVDGNPLTATTTVIGRAVE